MVSIDMKVNISIIISALVLMGVIYLAFIKKSEKYEDPVVPADKPADKPKEKEEPSTLKTLIVVLLIMSIILFLFWLFFGNSK